MTGLESSAPLATTSRDGMSAPFWAPALAAPGEDRQRLLQALITLWTLTMARPPSEFEDDLNLLRRWFDPVAQGSRLRRELATLPSPPAEWQDPGPPLTCAASGSRRLLTPEGRCLLHVLDQLGDAPLLADVTDAVVRPAEQLLLSTYRTWSRHRLDSVVALLDGENKPLQVSAAGVVIALLVNRCTAQQRALTRFADGPAREVVDDAFFDAVTAFATTLAPRRRGNRASASLISGWMLYEAGRRLGNGLVVVDARGGKDGAVWIEESAIPHVLTVVARDLARGHRNKVDAASLAAAFDAMVDTLRERLPRLAGYGLAHERPVATAHLRSQLLEAFAQGAA